MEPAQLPPCNAPFDLVFLDPPGKVGPKRGAKGPRKGWLPMTPYMEGGGVRQRVLARCLRYSMALP